MIGTRSFRQRILLALLAVALVPAAGAVVLGTLAMREFSSSVGTLGPWDAVAESGTALIDRARAADPSDTALAAAAAIHREALSESLVLSRRWAFLNDAFFSALPGVALLLAVIMALVSLGIARWLSGSFSKPIHELVGWTERISRSDPLPAEDVDRSGPEEFRTLRSALRTMAGELEQGRRRAVESARLKAWTEMGRRVAHEIKNPLTPMRMAAITIARGEARDHSETAEILLEEIGRLDEMARTFSQFGRMPEGPPSDVDLVEMLERLAEQHRTEASTISIRPEGDIPHVLGHYDVLGRAFRNLILNAVEAIEAGTDGKDRPAASGSEVEVVIRSVAEGVNVRISDSGPGIPDEILDTIWFPDVTTKHRGTGLGLATVKQAVEAHGGTVLAGNLEAGGAVFEIELPLRPTDD